MPTTTFSEPVAIVLKHGGPRGSPMAASRFPITNTVAPSAFTTRGCPLPNVSSADNKLQLHGAVIGPMQFGPDTCFHSIRFVVADICGINLSPSHNGDFPLIKTVLANTDASSGVVGATGHIQVASITERGFVGVIPGGQGGGDGRQG